MALRQLAGRDQELTELERFAAAPRGVLLLRGEAGIGKTALWLEGVSRLEAAGRRVLAARPAGAEAQLSFAALADLVADALDEVVGELPAPQRRALEVALSLRDPEGLQLDATTVARATLGAVRVLAKGGQLAIAIDDVQWLDTPTAVTLEFVLRRLGQDPVQLLLSQRTARRGEPLPLGLERADEVPEVLELRPLSLGALSRVLRTRLDVSFPRPVLRRIHEESRGNPLLALELGRALDSRQTPVEAGRPLPALPRYEELVQERVEVLPTRTREALLEVAALSEPTGDLVDLEALRPAFAAELLEQEGGRIRFAHPLVGAAVYAQAPRERVRAAHRALAERVDSREERARHLALAVEAPDAGVAAELEAAADEALTRGAPAAAAELLEHAFRHDPGSDRRTLRTRRAAEAHFQAGDTERARALLEEAVEGLPKGRERAEVLLELGIIRGEVESVIVELELLEAALLDAKEDPALSSRIHRRLARALFFHGDMRGASERAARAVELAERTGDGRLTAAALAVSVFVGAEVGDPVDEEVLDRALELEALELETPDSSLLLDETPTFVAGWYRLGRFELDSARGRFQALRERARARGDETGEAGAVYMLGLVELFAGNIDDASSYARECAELGEQSGTMLFAAPILQSRIDACLGRLDEARSGAEAVLRAAEKAEERTFMVSALGVLGFIELSAGRPEAAIPPLERAAALAEEFELRGLRAFRVDLVEGLAAVEAVEEAEAALLPFAQQAEQAGTPWALGLADYGRAIVLAARGEVGEAVGLLERAASTLTSAPFERARTLLVLGKVHRRAKHWGDARRRLDEALRGFERIGARAWAEKAKGELARVGGRAKSAGGLSETERRVAELVAEGKTNKEVAAELFLSVRGVEANLSRIYAKLGIRRRGELAPRLLSGFRQE